MATSYLDSLGDGGRKAERARVKPDDLRRRVDWPPEQDWRPDQAQDQLDPGLWTYVEGARVVTAGLERWRDCEYVMAPFTGEGAGVLQYTDGSSVPNWIAQGFAGGGWQRTDGTLVQALTGGYPASDLSALTGVTFNGYPIINDPTRAPYYWALGQAGDTVSAIPGWPGAAPVHDWQALALRGFREFLLAINLTESGIPLGDRLRWSDQALSGAMPSTWAPAPENLAGFIDLTGTTGDLVDGQALGADAFGLYKDEATYVLDYVGAPYVFRARAVSKVSGCLGVNTIAPVPFGNVLWNGADIVLNDGQAIRSIVADRLRTWLTRTLDDTRLDFIYAVPVTRRREVWFLAPLSGSDPDAGVLDILAWEWERDRWSVRTLPEPAANIAVGYVPPPDARPVSWELDSEAWQDDPTPWQQVDQVTLRTPCYVANRSGAGSAIIAVDSARGGDLGDPAAPSSSVRLVRESWDCGEPFRDKVVTGLVPRWSLENVLGEVPDTRVRIGVQRQLHEPIAWSPTYTIRTSAEGDARVDFPSDAKLRGVFISVELQMDLAEPWTFQGFDLEFRVSGRYVPPRAGA